MSEALEDDPPSLVFSFGRSRLKHSSCKKIFRTSHLCELSKNIAFRNLLAVPQYAKYLPLLLTQLRDGG